MATNDDGTLRAFRSELYGTFSAWGDALFELADAALCSPGPVHSVPSLSLEPEFSRSHGSLYKSLAKGRIEEEALRELLVAHAPKDWPLVFAVDASTWARCDAECSPERGFHYSASHHSAGQPIVAGWSYQWISQLNWAKDSWTAPADVMRISPAMDATTTTIDQVKRLCGRLPANREVPLFAFDAGYDPVAITDGLRDTRCEVLVRISSSRVFHPDPAPRDVGARTAPSPREALRALRRSELDTARRRTRRLRRELWNGSRSGLARTAPKAPRSGALEGDGRAADCPRHRHPRRRRAPPKAHGPRRQDTVAVVVGARRGRSRTVLSRLLAKVRHRTFVQIRKGDPRLDDAPALYALPSRPVDLDRRRRVYPTPIGPRPRRRPQAPLGATMRTREAHPVPRAARISTTACNRRHSSPATEIPNSRPRTAQRHRKTAQNSLSGGQEGCLTPRPGFN